MNPHARSLCTKGGCAAVIVPVKAGGRFSRKPAMPSRKSSEALMASTEECAMAASSVGPFGMTWRTKFF